MLVLSRKCRESIKLVVGGVEILVQITRVHGNTVGIGIEAPREVAIIRSELTKEVQTAIKGKRAKPEAIKT